MTFLLGYFLVTYHLASFSWLMALANEWGGAVASSLKTKIILFIFATPITVCFIIWGLTYKLINYAALDFK